MTEQSPPAREQRFAPQMSDAETLMWHVEQDPWLNPSGGSVTILDRPVDLDRFRRVVANAVAAVPRLRERVVPAPTPWSTPVWQPDREFDLSYHVRRVALPPPGTMPQLLDAVALNHQDPFDRTRPLWMFIVVDGLEGGRGALVWKAHHVVADGIGQSRLAEFYLDRERDAPAPPDVDLETVITAATTKARGGPGGAVSIPLAGIGTLAHLVRAEVTLGRRMLGELALWGADPLRAADAARRVLGTVRHTRTQLLGSGQTPGGSPLWRVRSRHRHLEVLRVPLDAAHAAAEALGGTVNDFFVAGAADGAISYHRQRGASLDALNITFVVSTRDDTAIGGNAFTPVRVQIPAEPLDAKERFHSVSARLAARRGEVHGAGMMSGLAVVGRLLPTSVVTGAARSQAAKIDFATSNLRGARSTRYICGSEVLESYAYGPLAGTAFNLTAISYHGSLHLALFVDPVAVSSPADLRADMQAAYGRLIEAGGVVL
jgi:WS/DGAT/MGAT family acyltransferase